MRLPSPGLMRVFAMELFTKLFGDLLLFVYHCFDRIVINGYLSGLSRPEQVVYFFRKVVGVAVLSKEILSQRTAEYQNWVEAFARNHNIPVEWAEKGVRKEDYVLPWLRRITKRNAYGVYFIFKSMEQGPTFRVSVPKYPTKDPNHRILARQRSRFPHDYFYIRHEVLGPMVMRVATFFPFQTTYYLKQKKGRGKLVPWRDATRSHATLTALGCRTEQLQGMMDATEGVHRGGLL